MNAIRDALVFLDLSNDLRKMPTLLKVHDRLHLWKGVQVVLVYCLELRQNQSWELKQNCNHISVFEKL